MEGMTPSEMEAILQHLGYNPYRASKGGRWGDLPATVMNSLSQPLGLPMTQSLNTAAVLPPFPSMFLQQLQLNDIGRIAAGVSSNPTLVSVLPPRSLQASNPHRRDNTIGRPPIDPVNLSSWAVRPMGMATDSALVWSSIAAGLSMTAFLQQQQSMPPQLGSSPLSNGGLLWSSLNSCGDAAASPNLAIGDRFRSLNGLIIEGGVPPSPLHTGLDNTNTNDDDECDDDDTAGAPSPPSSSQQSQHRLKTTAGTIKPDLKVKKQKSFPKRSLSAYNYFFQEERRRILAETPVKPEAARKRTRKDRPPPHGKISFQELGARISERWQSLTPSERHQYQRMAQMDRARYMREKEEALLESERAPSVVTVGGPMSPAASKKSRS